MTDLILTGFRLVIRLGTHTLEETMNTLLKKAGLVSLLSAITVIASTPASGANWWELQNTTPKNAPNAYLMGFVWPAYVYMPGTSGYNNNVPRYNLIGPYFNHSSDAYVPYARIYLRGRLSSKISYMLAAEFGNNGATDVGGNYYPNIPFANVTFNFIPGARIEVGVFHTPGPEFDIKGYMDYNNLEFPNVISQLMVQPFFYNNKNYQKIGYSAYLIPGRDGLGVNGFTYPGVQLFDWFRRGHWEFEYALMGGVFGSIDAGVRSNTPMFAARIQQFYIFGGHGPFRSDMSVFAWLQHANPTLGSHNYTMQREGVGLTYRQGFMRPWARQLTFEFINGDGWITAPAAYNVSATIPSAASETQLYPEINDRAYGYYVNGGLFITKHIEALLRYDYYNRLPNLPSSNIKFRTVSLGLAYYINPLMHVNLNYLFRNVNASPEAATNPIVRSVIDSTDNEITLWGSFGFSTFG